jgi:arylsulfate sulfotransferase
VLDTDGNVRWAYTYADSRIFTGPFSPESSAWYDNGFLVGGIDTLGMARIQLDGSFTYVATANFAAQNISTFHHNMEKGKAGYLALPNYQALPNISTGNIESDVIEFNPDTGEVLKSWDLKKILTDYITSSGDTVKQFFYTPSWFRVNSAAYDPTDNGLVVSSRENFVIKLDYDTGKIRWIFGDPSKYWYTDFPSLRAKALTLNPGGIYPMGQNAVSITGQGKLLMFNNRSVSSFQPMGANEVNSDRSLVSYYSTDGNSKTATEIWQFDHPSKLYAPYCSSAYMANDKSMLILYSSATGRITGVDANKNIVFDYSYAGSNYCAESWNATPIPFGNLNFTR